MSAKIETGPTIPDTIERAVVMQVHRDVPQKLARERVVVIPRDAIAYAEALKLPQLGDHRMRHNEVGQIFIDRYNRTGLQIELPELGPSIDLGFDSLEIVERLWPGMSDAETAIRYSKHIADAYDRKFGQESLSLLAIHKVIRFVSKELQKPGNERLSWDEIQSKVFLAIDSEGLNDARDPGKINLRDNIINAVSRDRRARENSARTRLMLANLYPSTTAMILQNEKKYNKYRYLESVLYRERARDRAPLEEFIVNVRELEGMIPRNAETNNFKKRIRQLAHTSMKPDKVRMAPYVQIAAVSRALLFSRNTPEETERLAGYIGQDLAEETSKVASYYEFKEYKDQLQRLRAVADYIEGSLEEADGNLPQLEQAA